MYTYILIYMYLRHDTKLERLIYHTEITPGCWNWLGQQSTTGYGRLKKGKSWTRAHRYSYELFVGDIPEGLVIDHLCRNTLCVNPEHLEAVTMRENVLRGVSPAAQYARRESCSKGHELSGDNLYLSRGARICKACKRDYMRGWYQARRTLRA